MIVEPLRDVLVTRTVETTPGRALIVTLGRLLDDQRSRPPAIP
ncbi:hypothetical protein ABZX93_16455 [Streptomyces sp. NPDC006632]